MKKIKIAQIGTSDNSHGNLIFETLMECNDIFEIIGYVMPENEFQKFPNRKELFNGYKELTLEEVLNNPEIEAVAVETEEKYLSKYAIMAAKHKKHIHMEKPGGLDLSEFEELIKIAKENRTVLHIGYMYRYNPFVIELLEEIKRGDLGEIICVEAQMNCIHPKEVREWLKNFQGGMMFFLGCHLIDLIYSIQGNPKRIIPLNKCSNIDGVTGEDFGMVVLEYENGVSFAKTSAVELGGFNRRQFVVTGTKKTVEIKPFEQYADDGKIVTQRFTRDTNVWTDEPICDISKPCDRYEGMMRGFAKLVTGEAENNYSYDYELELYKMILKACGRVIE